MPKYRNYLIFYQPLGDTIVVVRILHAAQDWTRFFRAQLRRLADGYAAAREAAKSTLRCLRLLKNS